MVSIHELYLHTKGITAPQNGNIFAQKNIEEPDNSACLISQFYKMNQMFARHTNR